VAVEQLHFENFFAAGYEIPSFIENDVARVTSVMIAAIELRYFTDFKFRKRQKKSVTARGPSKTQFEGPRCRDGLSDTLHLI